jgi:uncharacterized protein (TIGR04222 family)
MDLLLDNPLTDIYGPYFLILYGFVTLFTILSVLFIKTRVDRSDRLPMPPIPANIDPYEIAYLRGGINEMARTAVFSLIQKGLVEIKNDEKPPIITRTSVPDWRGTATVEDAALNWFVVSREPKEVFASDGLTDKLAPYADEYERRLSRQQLINGAGSDARLSKWKWSACLFLAALGGYKALASMAHGYFNLLGILVIAIVGVVMIAVNGYMPRLTKLGKAYLERLQTAFDGLRYQAANKPENAGLTPATADGTGGFDPMLLSVGIFGGVVLSGTSYWGYNEIFDKHQKDQAAASGGCGAGCGAGCSSGGSSCGSSGCSSGCGGGGCGGGGCGGS